MNSQDKPKSFDDAIQRMRHHASSNHQHFVKQLKQQAPVTTDGYLVGPHNKS